jgi:hypothetical protein
MEPRSSLPPEIFEVLERGGTLLTGNQRAARTLQQAFDRDRRDRGLPHWQPPAIFAWETWTTNLWHQLLVSGTASRILLNTSQELHIWRSIVAADPRHTSLQKIDSLAEMAAQAWKLLCAYRGQSRLGQLGVSQDTRTFQRWAQAFLHRCESDFYLSPSELDAALASSRRNLPAAELLLTGFDPSSSPCARREARSRSFSQRCQPSSSFSPRRRHPTRSYWKQRPASASSLKESRTHASPSSIPISPPRAARSTASFATF